MRFSSMTCPDEPLRVSSSGAAALTETTSSIGADLELEVEREAIADADLDLVAFDFLEPGQFDDDFVDARRQKRHAVIAIGVRRAGGGDVGFDVGDGDGDAWNGGALIVGDAPFDGASEVLCRGSRQWEGAEQQGQEGANEPGDAGLLGLRLPDLRLPGRAWNCRVFKAASIL